MYQKNGANQKWKLYGAVVAVCILIGVMIFVCWNFGFKEQKNVANSSKKSIYSIMSNSLEPFDLYFLQLENGKENVVYSPLSIKYALEMLNEAASGESKTQITNIIGEYESKQYQNNEKIALANAMFLKDTYYSSIQNSYVDTLFLKYNAEVRFDSFATPDHVNSWIRNQTLNLISDPLSNISSSQLLLINALALNLNWEEKFILNPGIGVSSSYEHETFGWIGDSDIVAHDFENQKESVAGMELIASINNYDILNEIGEEEIRKTVKKELEEYLKENSKDSLSNVFSKSEIASMSESELVEKYVDRYIKEIGSNYHLTEKTTDFSFYLDDNVKVFAKDLEKSNDVALQYVAIMPTGELSDYIDSITASDINVLLSQLKQLQYRNFKEGVVTKISGFIPKFQFEYRLNLMEDLKKLGIQNVFQSGLANLTNLSSDETLYIDQVLHQSNIEFTQEGIKASAVTTLSGGGAGMGFDYFYDVPVEEIDLTFDRPYLFFVRDKNSGEVWFLGQVYAPLSYDEDMTKGR